MLRALIRWWRTEAVEVTVKRYQGLTLKSVSTITIKTQSY